jgi:succinate-acetate transporter protein
MDTRVMLRPIGSPVPLGMAGLAGACLVTSGSELGWIAVSEATQVALALLAFAFPLQLIASILAFLGRDAVVGTTLGVLAATWLGDALIHLSMPPGTHSGALGLLLLMSSALVAAGSASAAPQKSVPALVFAVASIRFALLGVFNLGGSSSWQDAAAATGLALLVLAGYTVLAALLEGTHGRSVLPMGRHGHDVVPEAGVREQL